MAERPAYWAVIPASVRYDQDLPPSAKLLYGEITALSNAKGYCSARNAYFADLFGLGEKSVSRLIAILAKGGYLRVEVIRNEKNEVVERRTVPIYGEDGVRHPPLKNEDTPPPTSEGTPPPKNEEENNTSIEQIPPIVPQGGQPAKPEGPKEPKRKRAPKSVPVWKPERFEAFWAYYPRHEDRVSAVREWDRLKPEDGLIDTIARALKRQVQNKDWAVPYACRYLRNQRWLDELPKDGKAAPARPQARQLTGWHAEVIDGEEVLVEDG